MKKVISLLLCFCIMFTSVVPVYAADVDYFTEEDTNVYGYIDGLSLNVEGDCIYFTDAGGQIIEIKPTDIQPYSGLFSGFITLTGAAGSASIAGYVFPLLLILCAMGFAASDTQALVDVTMDVWANLTDDVQTAISNMSNNLEPGGNFAITAAIIAAVTAAANLVLTNDDGSAKEETDVTDFEGTSSSSDMDYNYGENGYNNNGQYWGDVYKTELSFDTANQIPNTNLTVQLVDSSWSTSGHPAILFTNTVTGVSLEWLNTESGQLGLLHSTCGKNYISPLISNNFNLVNGVTLDTIEHWFSISIKHVCESDTCAITGPKLWNTNEKDTYLTLHKEGFYLDGVTINKQSYDTTTNSFAYNCVRGQTGTKNEEKSVCGILLGQTVAIDAVLENELNEDTPIAVPTDYTNSDNYTSSGSGDVDTGIGWLDTIIAWLMSILEAIKAIPGEIAKAFDKLVDWIFEGVLRALKAAFIPSADFFTNFFADLQSTFSNRFGILTYPMSVLFNFLNTFLTLSEQEPVISWGSWSYQGTEFLSAGSYNLNDLLDNDTFKTIHNIYLVVVDACMVFLLLRFIEKKYRALTYN